MALEWLMTIHAQGQLYLCLSILLVHITALGTCWTPFPQISLAQNNHWRRRNWAWHCMSLHDQDELQGSMSMSCARSVIQSMVLWHGKEDEQLSMHQPSAAAPSPQVPRCWAGCARTTGLQQVWWNRRCLEDGQTHTEFIKMPHLYCSRGLKVLRIGLKQVSIGPGAGFKGQPYFKLSFL